MLSGIKRGGDSGEEMERDRKIHSNRQKGTDRREERERHRERHKERNRVREKDRKRKRGKEHSLNEVPGTV